MDEIELYLEGLKALQGRQKFEIAKKLLDEVPTEISLESVLGSFKPESMISYNSVKDRIPRVSRSNKEDQLNKILLKYGPWKMSKLVDSKTSFNEEYNFLWLDLSGFTKLCERLVDITGKNTITMGITQKLSEELSKIILENGGNVFKYEGDAIMALYNPDKIGAINAVYSACDMQKNLPEIVNNILKDEKVVPRKVYKELRDEDKEITMRVGITNNNGDPFVRVGKPLVNTDFLPRGESIEKVESLESTAVYIVNGKTVSGKTVSSEAVNSGTEVKGIQISEDIYEMVTDMFKYKEFDGKNYREFDFGKAFFVESANIDENIMEHDMSYYSEEEIHFYVSQFNNLRSKLKLMKNYNPSKTNLKDKLSKLVVEGALQSFKYNDEESKERWKQAMAVVPEPILDDLVYNSIEWFGSKASNIPQVDLNDDRVVGFITVAGMDNVYEVLDKIGEKKKLGKKFSNNVASKLFDELTTIVDDNQGIVDKYKTDTTFMIQWGPYEYLNATKAAVAMQNIDIAKIVNAVVPIDDLIKSGVNGDIDELNNAISEVYVKGGMDYGKIGGGRVGIPGSLISNTSLGNKVNRSARFAGYSKTGILFSEDIFDKINTQVVKKDEHLIPAYDGKKGLKGINKEMFVYEVERVKEDYEIGIEVTGTYQVEHLINRVDEIDLISNFLNEKGLMLIEGRKGYGKTFLQRKAFSKLGKAASAVYARPQKYGSAMSSAVQFMRNYLDITHIDNAETIKEKLGFEGGKYLGSLFNVDIEPVFIQGDALLEEQAKAFAKLMKKEDVVVIDDSHWLDDRSAKFFKILYDESLSSQIHMQRDDYGKKFNYTSEMELGPLRPDQLLEIAKNTIKTKYGKWDLRDQREFNKIILNEITDSENNVDYIKSLSQIIKNIGSEGDLASPEFKEKLKEAKKEFDDVVIWDALNLRVGGDESEREMLKQYADTLLVYSSILGKEFDKRVVDAICKKGENKIPGFDPGKVKLYQEFITRKILKVREDNTYTFTQSMLFEAFEKRAGKEGAAFTQKHRKAAEAYLEVFKVDNPYQSDPKTVDEICDKVARHYFLSERKKAASWLEHAGLKAFSNYDYKGAMLHYLRALNIRLEMNEEDKENYARDLEDKAEESVICNIDDAIKLYEEALDYRIKEKDWKWLDDEWDSAYSFSYVDETLYQLSECFTSLNLKHKSYEILIKKLNLLSNSLDIKDEELKGIIDDFLLRGNIATLENMGLSQLYMSNYDIALEFFKEEKEIFDKRGIKADRDLVIKMQYFLNKGETLMKKGDLEEAEKLFLEGKGIYEDESILSAFNNNLGKIYFEKGELEKSRKYSLDSIEIINKYSKENSCNFDSEVITTITQLNNYLPDNYHNLSKIEIKNKDYEVAIEQADNGLNVINEYKINTDYKYLLLEQKAIAQKELGVDYKQTLDLAKNECETRINKIEKNNENNVLDNKLNELNKDLMRINQLYK